MSKVLMLLMIPACTVIKNLPTKEYDQFSFDKSQNLNTFPVNQKMVVIYKSCSAGNVERNEAVAPLIKDFNLKFKARLLGLSNTKITQKKIIDSSLFPNEVCVTLRGNPITSEPMSGDASGEFVFEDHSSHIH